MAYPESLWTSEEDAVLRRDWIAGQSAAKIAKKLTGRTRNSVVSRVFRLGLNKEVRAIPSKPGTNRRTDANRQTGAARRRVNDAKAFAPGPKTKSDETRLQFAAAGQKIAEAFYEAANDTSVLLIDRRRTQCAWPVGNPDRPAMQMCCGAQADDGPYCPAHAAKGRNAATGLAKHSTKELIRSLRRVA